MTVEENKWEGVVEGMREYSIREYSEGDEKKVGNRRVGE